MTSFTATDFNPGASPTLSTSAGRDWRFSFFEFCYTVRNAPPPLDNGDNLELKRGWLIVFEGIDGTGKSTQCQKMETRMREYGVPVVRLREPTDGVWGQKIRKILSDGRGAVTPKEELTWFIEDRREDVEKNILPALRENKVVLLDRYYYSTAAYQGALGFDPEAICRDNEAFAPVPDLAYLFIVPPEQCLKRIEQSRDGYSSFERLEYLVKVQNIFESFHGPHIRKVDGVSSPDVIHGQLFLEIDELIGLIK